MEDTQERAEEENIAPDRSTPQRQIPGNLPYTTSIGPFKKVLEKLIESERPSSFNRDFMATVLGVSGGVANPVIPILKKTGLLTESGVPTPLYADFQTTSGRPEAALAALRRGFSEIFKRNQYAHKADKEKIQDLIRSITGLPAGDRTIGYMYNTFSALQHYARSASDLSSGKERSSETQSPDPKTDTIDPGRPAFGLSYQINIVLPESTNVDVFNAIFKSPRENLMK
jgi:hypothetical protein